MFKISALSHLVGGLVAIHRRNRNAALLNELSEATRRDIGWSDHFQRSDDRHRGWNLWRTRR